MSESEQNKQPAEEQQTQPVEQTTKQPEEKKQQLDDDEILLNAQRPQHEIGIKEYLQNMPQTKEKKSDWRFWKEQPVPQFDEKKESVQPGPIDAKKTVDDVRKEPYNLPEGYEWYDVDLQDPVELEKVYHHLAENYVEDDDNMFRFDYSPEFLKWALLPPGQYKEWIVGVRVIKTKKMVGFITGVPVHMILDNEHKIKMTEINFLCVYKKLRANRLAPVLIKEITRRVNRLDMWQAVYTAGVQIPTPVSRAQYYHRSLNQKKLIDIGFSSLGKNQTLSRIQKLYRLPEENNIPGLREMKKKDIPQVRELLNNYLSYHSSINFLFNFNYMLIFSENSNSTANLQMKKLSISSCQEKRLSIPMSFATLRLSKSRTSIHSISYKFYFMRQLPSQVIKNPKYKQLRASYSFYNVSTVTPLIQLIENALISAKQQDFDVYNVLDIQDNKQFLKELKFSPGDGYLHYYLYNWRLSQTLEPKELGMVLV